jgi:hypothetical protein
MNRASAVLAFLALAAVPLPLRSASPAPRTPKEALQAFNHLIGTWRATGTPEGTREQKQRGFWTEGMRWRWQFKGDDAWLRVVFEKGKYFNNGELHYSPDKDNYQLILTTTAKEKQTYVGPFKDHQLILDCPGDDKHEARRLVITLLHDNRFIYRYEAKPPDRQLFTRVYQVGATKEGVAFAQDQTGPECVVSGGLGTMAVTYKGQTYYVCCSGCRDAFKEDPEKYIKEYEAKKAKEKKR